jgi:hypothetical protein
MISLLKKSHSLQLPQSWPWANFGLEWSLNHVIFMLVKPSNYTHLNFIFFWILVDTSSMRMNIKMEHSWSPLTSSCFQAQSNEKNSLSLNWGAFRNIFSSNWKLQLIISLLPSNYCQTNLPKDFLYTSSPHLTNIILNY